MWQQHWLVTDATVKYQIPPLLGLSVCGIWIFQFLASSKPALSVNDNSDFYRLDQENYFDFLSYNPDS